MAAMLMRTANGWASLTYALQAAVLAIVLVLSARIGALPVSASFRDGAHVVTSSLGTVDPGWAIVTVLLGGAVTHALAAVRAGNATRPPTTRSGVVLAAGWSQGAGIVVFLVAQMNGIADAAALVPLFALSAGAACLLAIDDGSASGWHRPAAWAAVIGIVPWGVIAFAQIGATITLGTPPLGVRLVTIAALVVTAIGWSIGWRRPRAVGPHHIAIMTAAVSAVAWAIAMLGAPVS